MQGGGEGVVLVDLNGFEPMTSSMPWKRAPNCATGPLNQQIYYTTTLRLIQHYCPSTANLIPCDGPGDALWIKLALHFVGFVFGFGDRSLLA